MGEFDGCAFELPRIRISKKNNIQMDNIKWTVIFLFSLISNVSSAQDITILKKEIEQLLMDKDATVGVSVVGMSSGDVMSINGNKKLPMQSVYKFHLAAAVLHEVDKKKFDLDDSVEITKAHLDNTLWSVIRKKLPNGGKLTLREVVKYTVANSDNVGCDLLFDMIGGPIKVQRYMQEMGILKVAIKDNEAAIQSDWKLQYKNWTTAKAASQTLKLFYENKRKVLSAQSHQFLWEVMKQSWFAKMSIKAYLPANTVVAHKTGHSGKNDKGLTGAQNDIGIIFLPNGNYFYLSILISDSTEDSKVNKKIISDIAKLSYDYFKNKRQ